MQPDGDDPTGFWTAYKGAFDIDRSTSNARRRALATSAISTYDIWLPTHLEACAEGIEKLDNTVQRLFETANGIYNKEYRADAVQVAKYAREVHSAVALGQSLKERRWRLQRLQLDQIVQADGNLAVAFPSLKSGMDETLKVVSEIQAASTRSNKAMQELKDTFSSLRGKTNLTVYPLNVKTEGEKTKH